MSQRLKELEASGVIYRQPLPEDPEVMRYVLTEAGEELRPVIEAMGSWGQRWVEADPSLENLDASLLMWDMRHNLHRKLFPENRRHVIQFSYPEQSRPRRRWWLLVEPDQPVDLCQVEPGFDVDLYVNADLRTMTEIWLGLVTVERARKERRLQVVGNLQLERTMQGWLGLSPFAAFEKRMP